MAKQGGKFLMTECNYCIKMHIQIIGKPLDYLHYELSHLVSTV